MARRSKNDEADRQQGETRRQVPNLAVLNTRQPPRQTRRCPRIAEGWLPSVIGLEHSLGLCSRRCNTEDESRKPPILLFSQYYAALDARHRLTAACPLISHIP